LLLFGISYLNIYILILFLGYSLRICHSNPNDACIIGFDRFYGPHNCSAGEIQLNGTRVNLGIHNVGSFGTVSSFISDYYHKPLGILADYSKDGFNSSTAIPSFAGDFIVSSAGLEG
jgi:hypothetical protein